MSFNFLTLTKTDLLRLLASFILGFIIGITLFNLLITPQLDQLIYEKNKLLTKIENQQTQLEKLEESLAQEKKKIIQELEIEINTKLDKHIKQELKQKIFKILDSLIGRNINKIDGNLIANTLNERIIIIEKNNYELNLLWFIIKPHSVISFKVKKEK